VAAPPYPIVGTMTALRDNRTAAVAALALLASLSWGLAGCGGDDEDDPAAVSELVVSTAGGVDGGSPSYTFTMPDTVPPGPVRLVLDNTDDEAHHAQLFRLAPGATMDGLMAALATGDPAAALQHGTFEGGTALVDPGRRSRADAIVDLAAGDWAVICFVPGPDGLPHLAHGMVHPLAVTGAGPDPVPDVPTDGAVDLVDYAFGVPERLEAGATVTLTNRSTAEPHEMVVAQLDEGAGIDEVLAAIAAGGPPPARSVGGMQAILPGATARLQLGVDPGRYVLLCEVPSPDGVPHRAKGMIQEVTIT
jgi:hypothetical protein